MKKLLLSILFGVGIGSFVFFTNQDAIFPQQSSPISQVAPPITQTQTEEVHRPEESIVIENPETIKIPRLGVQAFVERVGLDEQKRMDVPQNYQNVAWYELGYAPGETGSAVMAGHFDTPQGTAGVFYEIGTLQNGDEIIVEGEDQTLTYSVVETEIYHFDQVPLDFVFNSQDEKRLNLITCDGVFDPAAQNYSQRLIVYAVLTE